MPEKKKLPVKNREMPATVGLVVETRDELKSDIRSVRNELKAEIQSVHGELKAEIQSVRCELKAEIKSVHCELKTEIDLLRSDMKAMEHRLASKIDQILVSVHRTQAIVEEQRGENRVMLEALNGFVTRMDRLEKRQDDQDATIRVLAKSQKNC